MPKKRVLLLLNCHSLEDFPTWKKGDEASQLLAYWTTSWHPSLLVATNEAPRWKSVDHYDLDAELQVEGPIAILCPSSVFASMSDELKQSILERDHVSIIHEHHSREQLADELHRRLDVEKSDSLDDDLVGDFYCLAYSLLQIELQTRQMHYTSHINMEQLEGELMKAANAANLGDRQGAEKSIDACFQLLAAERDHYYPVDAYILDLHLVARATDAACVLRALQQTGDDSATNLWMTGEVLEYHAKHNPNVILAIQDRLDGPDKILSLVGGDHYELAIPIEQRELCLHNLRRAAETYRACLGRTPTAYFRRRFGLSGILPDLLASIGYSGVVHSTLDAGRFPQCSQARTQWQIDSSETIEAVGSIPMDVSAPETFLQFASRMGQSMEMDYVATVCLAHWSGQACPWYEDLRRTTRYGSVLGKFTSFETYFHETSSNARTDTFEADEYRSPYLDQVSKQRQVNPISHLARRWQIVARLNRIATLGCWAILFGGQDAASREVANAALRQNQRWLNDLLVSEYADLPNTESVEELEQKVLAGLANNIAGSGGNVGAGKLLINTASGNQRLDAHSPHPLDSPKVYCQWQDERGADLSVDVPANGFVWLSESGEDQTAEESIVAGLELRNEFMTAVVDAQTGALQAVEDFRTRGSRLAQRLVRQTESGSEDCRMECTSVKTTANSPVAGVIVTEGNLLSGDTEIAQFQQQLTLRRGSRVLRLDIQLRPQQLPTGTVWKDYFASRWALPRTDFRLIRSSHGIRHATDARRCESPEYLEVNQEQRRTSILTGGIMYHTRRDERMLDSLLIVTGETGTSFSFGLGIDLPQPAVTAANWFLPTLAVDLESGPAANQGWLFHIDAKQVISTGWEPVFQDDAVAGFRVRVLETAGRSGEVRLRCAKPIRRASRTNFLGEEKSEVETMDGLVKLGIGPFEWTEVECRWD